MLIGCGCYIMYDRISLPVHGLASRQTFLRNSVRGINLNEVPHTHYSFIHASLAIPDYFYTFIPSKVVSLPSVSIHCKLNQYACTANMLTGSTPGPNIAGDNATCMINQEAKVAFPSITWRET